MHGAGNDFIVATDALVVEGDNKNVGIGTASPAQLLEVSRATAGDAYIKIENEDSTATSDAGIILATENGAEFIVQLDRSIGTDGALTFAGNTADNLVIDHDTGKVGIGTATPAEKLHVKGGTGDSYIVIENSTADEAGIRMVNPSIAVNELIFGGTGANNEILGGTLAGDFAMTLRTGGAIRLSADTAFQASAGINLLENGNVGIGVSSPAAADKVTIVQSSTAGSTTGLFINANGASAATGYGLYSTKTGASVTNIAGYFSATGATNNYGLIVNAGDIGMGTSTPHHSADYTTLSLNEATGGQIEFKTGDVGKQYIFSTATDLTFYNLNGDFIFTDGKVGIGETSPDYPLHVTSSGEIQAKFESTDAISDVVILDSSGYIRLRNNDGEFNLLTDGDTKTPITTSNGNVSFGGTLTAVAGIFADGLKSSDYTPRN